MDETLDFLRDRLPQIQDQLMQDSLRREMYDAEVFENKPRVLRPALETPAHQYNHLEEMESNSGSDLQSRMGSFLNNLEEPVEIADSWITPYRKRWIEHTSGKNPITDPVYRKELQDIILYPERTGLGPV